MMGKTAAGSLRSKQISRRKPIAALLAVLFLVMWIPSNTFADAPSPVFDEMTNGVFPLWQADPAEHVLHWTSGVLISLFLALSFWPKGTPGRHRKTCHRNK